MPDDVERARLAATLGAALRDMRTQRGLSTRALAERAALARSTVTRLEAGQRRPRPVVLEALAYGLDHEHPEPLAQALAEAAGTSLRPDTPAGRRRHTRRLRTAHRKAERRRGRVLAAAAAMHRATAGWATNAIGPLSPKAMNDPAALKAALERIERARLHANRMDNAARSARAWLDQATHPLDLQALRYAEAHIRDAQQ